MATRFRLLVLSALLALAGGCGDDGESNGPASTPGIFAELGEPRPSASAEQLATFQRGRLVARRVFTPADGLGPTFNQTMTCGGCHEQPVTGGASARYRDFQLVRQVLPDGSFVNLGVNGVQDQYTLAAGGRQPSDSGVNLEAGRNAIPFFGVGLLAEIPEAEILRYADENDADGDGVSGRPNYDRGFVGRFGRKAQTVSIEGFIRGPLFNHLGITTNPLSDADKARLPVPSSTAPAAGSGSGGQVAAPDAPTVDHDLAPDPELSEQDLFDLVSFAMLLAAPQPDAPTPRTESGSRLFEEIGCTKCHVRALNGPRGPVPAYTDLLLHDMGIDLSDGIKMGLAKDSEFRTQPLWGVVAVPPYLHDGRADTLDEAIRLHGGEGTAARDAYLALDANGRAEVVAFLESLGGSKQHSSGLLPPGAPIPPVGALGGPVRPLSADEEALFRRGRAVFDRDTAIGAGLGPRFNGDSCRACHFLPVIGGAGSAEVDVIRQGHLEDGMFTPPPGGTMAHRFATDGTRPPLDPSSNVTETRETPPVFGLGFLESVPEDAILANENCNDPDPMAVSGCAHILDSGRLGRLGWKANVPSLAEFARDAMFNEMGVTLPAIPGQTFGALTDDDNVPDPELSQDDLAALVFFMRNLAPPPGKSTNPTAEANGKALFASVGCTKCHVEDFVTPQGVVAYTDLLLHQIAEDGSRGIADGSAGPLEIRTPPLWGLSLTPPYLHTGRAFSVEVAIAAHDFEAAQARSNYEMLSESDRYDLLAFLGSL